jgi:4'-phosphopantetheinyl transferase
MLMMRHRRIPRARWKDHVTTNNKHWIEQVCIYFFITPTTYRIVFDFSCSQTHEDMHPEKYMHSMIGYCLAPEQSIIGMAMTQGRQKHVVTIGLGLKQISTFPYGTSISTYCESYAHKVRSDPFFTFQAKKKLIVLPLYSRMQLTPLEQSFINPELTDDVRLRRLCIIISLKAAYIRAIGQPSGFDWSRLEFNVPQSTAKGDGHPLGGWEFRIWKTQVGVERKDTIVEESYQCACAFFRGSEESTFIWEENTKDLESWVQYLTLDQLLKVIPKLTA